jgi:hypothetical protein
MATRYRKDSFLKNAKQRDSQFLDINELPTIRKSTKDEPYVIPPEYDQRPDLLAFLAYESSHLWWVFAMRNPDIIKDPIRDFRAGLRIMLPSAEIVNSITSR